MNLLRLYLHLSKLDAFTSSAMQGKDAYLLWFRKSSSYIYLTSLMLTSNWLMALPLLKARGINMMPLP